MAEYVADHPADAGAPGDAAARVWRSFRDEASHAYRALLQALIEAQQGLCLYCEQRLVKPDGTPVHNDYQVEHVLAKSGGPGRTLDWTNLALACGGGTYRHHQDDSRRGTGKPNESCGQRKDDHDLPLGCDPRTFPGAARLVTIDVQGRILPDDAACHAAGVSPVALGRAINETLNLNCERLRTRRQAVFDNVRGWIVPTLNRLLQDAHLTTAQRRDLGALLIAARLQPDAHGMLRAFWTTERCGLNPGADAWCVQYEARST